MPTYEYECENKHRFEKWQSMKDDALTECLECGAPVRRIMHPAGIIFKGSGWYITDSRKGGSSDSESSTAKKDAKSEAKTDSTDSKAETKSEAKSDTKSESKSESKSDSGSAKSESKASE